MAFDIEAFYDRLDKLEAEQPQRRAQRLQREAEDSHRRELDRLRAIVARDLRAHPLRRVRLAEDMSMVELAVKAKLTPRTVQRIELRETTPTAKTMRKLAKALGVDVETISEATP